MKYFLSSTFILKLCLWSIPGEWRIRMNLRTIIITKPTKTSCMFYGIYWICWALVSSSCSMLQEVCTWIACSMLQEVCTWIACSMLQEVCTWIAHQGLNSLIGKTSYRKNLWSLEATRFGFRLFQLLWNLTGTSSAVLLSSWDTCQFW